MRKIIEKFNRWIKKLNIRLIIMEIWHIYWRIELKDGNNGKINEMNWKINRRNNGIKKFNKEMWRMINW